MSIRTSLSKGLTGSGQVRCLNQQCFNSNHALFEERFCFTLDSEVFDYWECLKCHNTAAKEEWDLFNAGTNEHGEDDRKHQLLHSISLYTSDGQSFPFYDQDTKSPEESSEEEASSASSLETCKDENAPPRKLRPKFLRPCQCGNSDFRHFKPVLDTDRQEISDLVYCLECGDCQGIDDTMSDYDFQKLIEKGRITTTPCKVCSNNDIDEFNFTGLEDGFGLQCNICGTMVQDAEMQKDYYCVDRDEQICLSDLSIACRCGNQDYESMYVIVNGDGDVTQIECKCGQKFDLDGEDGTRCVRCSNTKPENFTYQHDEKGVLTHIDCGQCCFSFHPRELNKQTEYNFNKASQQCHGVKKKKKTPILPKTRIKSLDELKPGDHVAWHRELGYWHHALVVEYGHLSRQLKVIEYHGLVRKGYGIIDKAEVTEHWIQTDPQKEYLYRINYEPDECFPVEKTMELARKCLGERRYDLLKRNCEHFVKTCKTGECKSSQKTDLKNTLKLVGVKLSSILAKKCALAGCRVGIPKLQGALRAFVHGNAITGLGALMVGGLTAVVEAGYLLKQIKKIYSMEKKGQIKRDVFVNAVITKVAQSVTSVGGALAGSAVGTLLIPVPYLGSLIGCTVGILLGKLLGTILGRQIIGLKDAICARIKDDKNYIVDSY